MSSASSTSINATSARSPHRGAAGMAPQSGRKDSSIDASADTKSTCSPSFTVVTSGSERVVHVHDPERQTSSGGSISARSRVSSGGSRSLSSEESWSDVGYDDDIDPSDSASRSRQSSSRRHTVEARPAPKRRHSSRRVVEHEDPPPRRHSTRRHHSSRHESRHESTSRPARSSSRRVRVPSDESASTLASADDYPPYRRMSRAAYPPMSGYHQHPPHGYPPSMTSGGSYPDPYAHAQGALVHMRHDPFGYPAQPQGNPFSPASQQQNPFSPLGSNDSHSYFAADPMGPPPPRHPRPDAPARPQSFVAPSYYGSELMSPHHGIPGYSPYGYPGYPPAPRGWTSSAGSSPPPVDRTLTEIEAMKAQFQELIKKRDAEDVASIEKVKKDAKNAEIESLKELIKKHQEEAVAQQKAWVAEREAEAAARAAEKAKAEEEAKRKKEIEEAKKNAKEDAEKKAAEAAKKAKEEHEKKLAEATEAKEKADKAKKALEDEIAKNKPTPDDLKAPIKFKDAVGRKFSFPWRLCKTWKGMDALIKQAFMHVDVIGDHVHKGHYDLTGPDGEIILPQVWDSMIQPDWEITMHLWPMEEKKKQKSPPPMPNDPFAGLAGLEGLDLGGGLGGLPPGFDFGMGPMPKKGGKKVIDGKKKRMSPDIMDVHPMMPPPPPPPGKMPGGPGAPFGDPFAGLGGIGGYPGLTPLDKKAKAKPKKAVKGKELSPFASWLVGGTAKPSKKR